MRYRHTFKTFFAVSVLGALLTGASPQALAENAAEAKPLELRRIMQELGKNMQAVTDGISREDWALVARIAPQIAEHPQPPAGEKMRIMAFIGADMGKFKGHDEKTHQAAQALEQAATRSDGQSVISSFATLQNSCLACHQSFRKPFVEHFYGQR
jgi:cytochrome c556